MLNEFEVVMSDDSETVYPGDVIVLDGVDVENVTEANLADAFLSLAHLIDLGLTWVMDNLRVVDMASIEDALERIEVNVDDLVAFRTVMEYMDYDVPEYVPEFNVRSCPVCGHMDPSVA